MPNIHLGKRWERNAQKICTDLMGFTAHAIITVDHHHHHHHGEKKMEDYMCYQA
jgi:hypothetical protein